MREIHRYAEIDRGGQCQPVALQLRIDARIVGDGDADRAGNERQIGQRQAVPALELAFTGVAHPIDGGEIHLGRLKDVRHRLPRLLQALAGGGPDGVLDLAGPFRQELGAVVGDAGPRRRQRRDEGQQGLACQRQAAPSPWRGPVAQVLDRGHRLRAGRRPAMFRRALQTPGARLPRKRRIGQDPLQLAGEVERVVRVEEQRVVGDHLDQAGGARGQRRRAARHGFQRRETESFVRRGEDEGVALTVQPDQVRFGNMLAKAQLRCRDAVAGGRDLQPASLLLEQSPREGQVPALAQTFGQLRERREDQLHVLPRIDRADIEQERPVELIARAQRRALGIVQAGLTEIGVHAAADHRDRFGRDVQPLDRLPARIFGHGKEQVGPLEELRPSEPVKPGELLGEIPLGIG